MPFTSEEFERLVLDGAKSLLARGFALAETTEFTVALRKASVTIRFFQERGDQIEVDIRRDRDDAPIGLCEIRRFLGTPSVAARSCRTTSAALVEVASLAEFFVDEGSGWIDGEPDAWGALDAWVGVHRALYTQSCTHSARPESRWDLIMSAWEGHRYGRVLKFLEALPPPHTSAEAEAAAYCRARIADGA